MGTAAKPKTFTLTAADGLRSHLADTGTYVPPELSMFVELFRKRNEDWEIGEETEIFPLGEGFWVPDFRLRHKESGRRVLLEVLGFWRRASAEKHLERLRHHVREPFLLAVSDALKIDEGELEGLPAGIHRFRQMPLPNEVVRLAEELLGLDGKKKGRRDKASRRPPSRKNAISVFRPLRSCPRCAPAAQGRSPAKTTADRWPGRSLPRTARQYPALPQCDQPCGRTLHRALAGVVASRFLSRVGNHDAVLSLWGLGGRNIAAKTNLAHVDAPPSCSWIQCKWRANGRLTFGEKACVTGSGAFGRCAIAPAAPSLEDGDYSYVHGDRNAVHRRAIPPAAG